MAHLKRLASPKSWIIPRKGTKYVLIAYPGKEISMPLGMLVRDLLKLTSIKKETRSFLKKKEIMIDGKVIEEEKFPVGLFDTVALKSLGKFYRIIINEHGKFDVQEIKENEVNQKPYKVMGKTSLKNGKMQLNLFNGRNMISDKKVKVNDSVVVDLQKNSILKHIPLKDGASIYVLGGKHMGCFGVVEKIIERNAKVKIGKESSEIPLDKIYVLE
ncbi:MAG: hypothetical protein KKE23_04610 [Nanoarchaeota archaeon]|nr:hypothetical protein [Nanoarchaeota archaeon]